MKKLFLQSGDACGICGGPCVVGSKGLYCPRCQPNKALNEVGIAATGIAEAVPESGENAEHIPQWIIDYDAKNFSSSAGKAIRILMNKLKSVSLPPQAERDEELKNWDELLNVCGFGWAGREKFIDQVSAIFSLTRKTKP